MLALLALDLVVSPIYLVPQGKLAIAVLDSLVVVSAVAAVGGESMEVLAVLWPKPEPTPPPVPKMTRQQ